MLLRPLLLPLLLLLALLLRVKRSSSLFACQDVFFDCSSKWPHLHPAHQATIAQARNEIPIPKQKTNRFKAYTLTADAADAAAAPTTTSVAGTAAYLK